MMNGNVWLTDEQNEIFGELEKRGWERDGGCWRKYPFILVRRVPRISTNKEAPAVVLWHLQRTDEHPGSAWFSNETFSELFTIVDAEEAAWR